MTHNPDEHLLDLLLRRFSWMEAGLTRRLNDAGWGDLSRPQIMLFAYLHGSGSSTSDVARSLRVSRQAVHQMVKELERKDLLRQVPDPARGNAKLIVKTQKGFELNDIAREFLRDLDQMLTQRIGTDRVNTLREILLSDWGEPG